VVVLATQGEIPGPLSSPGNEGGGGATARTGSISTQRVKTNGRVVPIEALSLYVRLHIRHAFTPPVSTRTVNQKRVQAIQGLIRDQFRFQTSEGSLMEIDWEISRKILIRNDDITPTD